MTRSRPGVHHRKRAQAHTPYTVHSPVHQSGRRHFLEPLCKSRRIQTAEMTSGRPRNNAQSTSNMESAGFVPSKAALVRLSKSFVLVVYDEVVIFRPAFAVRSCSGCTVTWQSTYRACQERHNIWRTLASIQSGLFSRRPICSSTCW
jgi:hypothetical protein